MTTKPRKMLASHGRRGNWVKVFLEKGHELVRVQWKEAGRGIQTQSWPNTKENRSTATAWADGLNVRLSEGQPAKRDRLTLLQLWTLYAEANFPHLRPRSQKLYKENFRRWALMWGWEFIAERTTPEMADQFRAESRALGLATTTIRKTLYDVKMVFAWAESRELLHRNRLRLYRFKIAKEDRAAPPAEYRADDFQKILGALDPAKSKQWRAWVALALCGLQGARQNAVLHLQLSDLALDGSEPSVTWRSRWDKLGKEWTQPLRVESVRVIRIALAWRNRIGYAGPWLLPAGSSKSKQETYSPQSLWAALQLAEINGKVKHSDRRGAHGLRRLLAGDVAAATGDFMLGLQAIGDSDPRMATRYIQRRTDRVKAAFDQIDAPQAEPENATLPQPENETGPDSTESDPATLNREALEW